MRRVILVLVALSLAGAAFGQKDTKADNWQGRYAKLTKAYNKNPDDVPTLIGLAQFYSDESNPMLNYASAMRHICKAEEVYSEMVLSDDKFKEVHKLVSKNITVVGVRQIKQEIVDKTSAYLTREQDLPESLTNDIADAFKNYPAIVRQITDRRYDQRFAEARATNTLAGYREFIENYPNMAQSEQAAAEMGKLAADIAAKAQTEAEVDAALKDYYDVPQVRQVAVKRQSALAYAQLTANPSPAAYQAFLQRYPGSDEYLDVLSKMESLVENEFEAINTPEGYAQFALQHQDNALADTAIARLKRLITEERDPKAVKLYLKHFPLDVSYNDIYLLYYNWHKEEGNAAPLRKFADENPDFPYALALQEELEKAERYDKTNTNMPYHEKDFAEWNIKMQFLTGRLGVFVGLQRMVQPYIAAGQWEKIPQRVKQFEIIFEDECVEQVSELLSITNAPTNAARARTRVVCPAYDMTHPVMHPEQNLLFFNKKNGDKWQICQARMTTGKKVVWRNEGAIAFANMTNENLQLYSLYDDGTKMLFGREGDIMTAEWHDTVWVWTSTLPAPVNSAYNDYDAFMVADGSGLLFASDRPGGHNLQASRAYFHGDTALASDLYFAPYNDGQWGEPINLGININSPYMECSPVLSDDLKTLYFITDGRGGLGYGDLYYSTRDDVNDWRHWAKPLNYGKEANSGFNEISVALGHAGKLTLCSNSQGHYGCYSVATLGENSGSFKRVRIVSGEVGFTVDVFDAGTQKLLIHNQPVARDSVWSSSFYTGKEYLLLGRCNGMYIPGMTFNSDNNTQIVPTVYSEAELLARGKEGNSLPLPAVHFADGGSELTAAAQAEMANLADFLRRHPSLSVELAVSASGDDDAACFATSQNRGQALKRHIIQKGIEGDRVAVSAYGNSLTKRDATVPQVGLIFFAQ